MLPHTLYMQSSDGSGNFSCLFISSCLSSTLLGGLLHNLEMCLFILRLGCIFCRNLVFVSIPTPCRIILGSQSEVCPSLALVSCVCVCVHTKSLQSCPTLCDTMDHRPPGSSVHRILQGRILERIAMFSSRGSSQPRDQPCVFYVSCFRWVLCH